MKKLIIILAAIALVGGFTASAVAAEWNFYGSARMATFWTSDDIGDYQFFDGSNSIDSLQWDLQGNARLGATVKANDQIGGGFEYGSGPNLRKLYGTYNFGAGELLIGQTYTPLGSYFYSNSVFDGDGDLLGVGQFYNGRHPMIQLKMAGFKIALVTPNVFGDIYGPTSAVTEGYIATISEVKLPKIEVSYHFKADAFFADVYGGYQTIDQRGEDGLGNSFDESVDSWVVGIGGGINLGPAYLKAGGHISKNAGQYGQYNPGAMFDEAIWDGSTIVDNDGVGYLAVLGFKANDMITIEAGLGYEKQELDLSGAEKDETLQYYANCTYVITPGFFVVPEIGYIDYKNDAYGIDDGNLTYYGLKWQINF